MNHITKYSSITLMGIIITITTTLYSSPVNAKLLIKTVAEAKNQAGQPCFAENNDFVAIYCNCRSQETDDGSGDCTDGSYSMSTSGWCKLPGGGDGIGTAYCAAKSADTLNTCSFCNFLSNDCDMETIDNPGSEYLYTEDGYSPYVFYYYEYKKPQTTTDYRCDGGRTKKYTCMPGEYAYDIDASSGRIEECTACPTITGTDGNNYATTAFPNTGTITSCYAPAGKYKDKTGTFTLSDKCYYTK